MQGKFNHSFEEYLAFDAVSSSRFKRFIQNPALYNHYEVKDTDALRFGSAFHDFLLEGGKSTVVFDKAELPFPDATMRKSENKAWYEQFQTSSFAPF